MNPPNAVVEDQAFEDEVARQIMKSRSPAWLHLVLVLMSLTALGIFALDVWMTAHPEKWSKLLDDYGVQNPKPFGIAMAIIAVAVAAMAVRIRLKETDTTLKWWIRIYYRRWFSKTKRIRSSAAEKKVLVTAGLSMLCMYQKIKAGTTVVVCIVAVLVAVGYLYFTNRCEPKVYLTVQVADNGLPVRGTWGVSEAIPATLKAEDKMRAQGPFKKGDGEAVRRAAINNAWDAEAFDQTKYPYPIGPLAATPKERIILERRTLGGTNSAPRALVTATVAGGDNWNFIQLPRWDLTNAATMGSEEFTRARPELGGMSIAQKIREAQAAGSLYTSDAPDAFFSVSESEVSDP